MAKTLMPKSLTRLAATSSWVESGLEAISTRSAPPACSVRARLAVSAVTCRQADIFSPASGFSLAKRARRVVRAARAERGRQDHPHVDPGRTGRPGLGGGPAVRPAVLQPRPRPPPPGRAGDAGRGRLPGADRPGKPDLLRPAVRAERG